MTKRVGNVIIIEPEPNQQCDDCGEIRELRPYGPRFSCVCFQCMKKDEEGAERRMNDILYHGQEVGAVIDLRGESTEGAQR